VAPGPDLGPAPAPDHDTAHATDHATDHADELADGLRALAADLAVETDRQAGLVGAFTDARPGVAIGSAPSLTDDVHDLVGLRRVGDLLAQGTVGPVS